jgi:hypothetical protein
LFSTGRYTVTLTGFDFSTDPEIPACDGPIGVPRSGKGVTVELQVVREGAEWVGRGTSPGNDIEMRFRDAGLSSLGRRMFSGSIRGRAPDAGLRGTTEPVDVVVVIGSGAIVEGQTAFLTTASTLVGRARGQFGFSDTAGNSGTCSVVAIHINAPG